MTEVKYAPEIVFIKDTPYIALTGEIWGVFWVNLGEIRQRYNDTALY